MSTDSDQTKKRGLFYLENPLLLTKVVRRDIGDKISFNEYDVRFGKDHQQDMVEIVDGIVYLNFESEESLTEKDKAFILYICTCMVVKDLASSSTISDLDAKNANAFARFWCEK